jgi:hypothetical protein
VLGQQEQERRLCANDTDEDLAVQRALYESVQSALYESVRDTVLPKQDNNTIGSVPVHVAERNRKVIPRAILSIKHNKKLPILQPNSDRTVTFGVIVREKICIYECKIPE